MSPANAFVKKQKIKFQHVDYAGIVFYPRYLEMLNELVEDWFADALHLSFGDMHTTAGIPTVDLSVQFRRAARLEEVLDLSLWVEEMGNSSVLCAFRFENQNGQLILEGKVRLVYVSISDDRKTIKSKEFPSELRREMEKYLG